MCWYCRLSLSLVDFGICFGKTAKSSSSSLHTKKRTKGSLLLKQCRLKNIFVGRPVFLVVCVAFFLFICFFVFLLSLEAWDSYVLN